MQHTAVKPPAAAARVPDRDRLLVLEAGLAQVHVDVDEPRAHHLAGDVEHRAFPRAPGARGPSLAMRPSAIEHVLDAVDPLAGSRTRPFTEEEAHAAPAPGEEIEHRHPDGDAVGDLVEDHRVGPVGHLGRELHAAVHRARMHDQHVGPAMLAACRARAPRPASTRAPTGMRPACIRSCWRRSIMTTSAWAMASSSRWLTFTPSSWQAARDQGGRPRHRHRHAHRLHAVDVRARHAAVRRRRPRW